MWFKWQRFLRAKVLFVLGIVSIGSCSSGAAPPSMIATHRTLSSDVATADARLVGRLVLKGRCIVVRESDNGSLIHPSWPEGFESNVQRDIIDNSGKVIAQIGQIVVLAGGGSDWFNIDTAATDAEECRKFPTFVVDRVLAG